MTSGEKPKLILGYDEEGKFKIDRIQAELLGLTESEEGWILLKPEDPAFHKTSADIIWLEFNEDRTYKAKDGKEFRSPADFRFWLHLSK